MSRWYLAGAIGLLAVAVFMLWPKGGSQTAQGAGGSAAPPRQGPRIVFSGSGDPAPARQEYLPQMNVTAPGDIKSAMVSQVVEKNGRKALILKDGSQVLLDPYTQGQLSGDVRFLTEYRREGP